MRTRFIVLSCLAMIAGCAAHRAQRASPPESAPTVKATTEGPISDELLDNLALFATNAPRDRTKYPRVPDNAALDVFIDALVDDPRFAEDVAPELLMPHLLFRSGRKDLMVALSVDKSGPLPIYFLRKTCDVGRAEDVHPWWALETTVKVCPEAHQPTHLRSPVSGTYCGDSTHGDSYCGCGPNLAFCVRDAEQREAIVASLSYEMSSTVARVVAENRPIDDAYLTNETERDRNAEFVYRRWRLSAGESPSILSDLPSWPEKPVLARRTETTPGQHAGVLTTGGALGIESSRRARMKWFYEAMWCDEPPGGTVSTAAVLELKKGDVRSGDGWEQLAAKPFCTDCHARLDYGGQFFLGYGINYAYEPKEHVTGVGKLFARDISDYRGEAPLDPQSFAKLAVAQPEFAECVVLDVKRHVFDDAWDSTDDDELRAAFRSGRSLKAVLRVALRTFARHTRARDRAPEASRESTELEPMIQSYCSDCHGEKRLPDFSKLSDPMTLRRALTEVAFGKMPRAPVAMPTVDRERMVDLLIQRIWKDGGAQAEARAYFAGARALPVHRVKGTLAAVNERAGASERSAGFTRAPEQLTRPDLLRYSPGVAAMIHLEALTSCKAAGRTGKALEACIEQAVKFAGTARTTITK